MIHVIEEAFQVAVHRLGITRGGSFPDRPHRVMRVVAFPVGEAVSTERFLEHPAQHLGEGLLDHPVQHRRDA